MKNTSYSYGLDYQLKQAIKHRNRKNNHWKLRIEILNYLIDNYTLPKLLHDKVLEEIISLDVGCSIGTMAIEMASRGFRSYGVDFDPTSIQIANKLAEEENLNIDFQVSDISEWKLSSENDQKIDIALCFDIFEHLHDDEIGALLNSVKGKLNSNGALIFHTFPQEYEYIFHTKLIYRLPLILFNFFSTNVFLKATKIWALIIDCIYVIKNGDVHKMRIKKHSHCNPTTIARLKDILERSGFHVTYIKSSSDYPNQNSNMKFFDRHPITHRNIFGVAHLT